MKSSGILLHLSSLPGRYGVGSFAEADKFIDFMKAARQRYWQILPVTPTDDAHSPYASVSAFAGNKLFIDVEQPATFLCINRTVDWERNDRYGFHHVGNDFRAFYRVVFTTLQQNAYFKSYEIFFVLVDESLYFA